MNLMGYVGGAAGTGALSRADLHKPRMELVVHAGGGLLVLLVITTLSVFKPWGLTRYGQRKLQERRNVPQQLDSVTRAPLGFNVHLAVIGLLLAVFVVVLHLTGQGLHHSH